MAKGELLGHIDCPSCGLVKGMRITEDKNGQPFGYCEGDCSQQLRIGGDARRVNQFYAKHPHIKRPGTVTHTEEKPAPAPVSEPAQTPTPPKKGGSALEALGIY
jgi:hypothetical protein